MAATGKKETEKVFAHLMREVHFDLCMNCGACIASCPLGSLGLADGRPALKGSCTACGLCYEQCPQISTDQEIAERVFGEKPEPDSIGFYEKAYSAQTKLPDVQVRAQDGGAVTTLLISLLEKGFIDGAVVMGVGEDPWRPEPRVATTREELIECAGTKYSPAPSLVGVREAVDYYSLDELALVGVPCQIKALRQMDTGEKPARRITSSVKLAVGIFCMKAFPYDGFFRKVIEDQLDLDLSEIAKFDIKKGNFIIYREGKPKRELGLKGLAQFSFLPCGLCSDFTAELADVSIGSTGSPSGYSTVLLRTPVGIQAFNQAIRVRALKTELLDDDGSELEKVRKVSTKKKRDTEKEIQMRRRKDEPLPPRLQEPSD